MAKKKSNPSKTSQNNTSFNNLSAFQELKQREDERKKQEALNTQLTPESKAVPVWQNKMPPKASKPATSPQWQSTCRENLYEDATSQDENLTDEELFLMSVGNLQKADVYQTKFSQKELPRETRKQEPALTLTEEEREMAIFTQEMAVGHIRRFEDNRRAIALKNAAKPKKQIPRIPNRVPSSEISEIIENSENSSINPETEDNTSENFVNIEFSTISTEPQISTPPTPVKNTQPDEQKSETDAKPDVSNPHIDLIRDIMQHQDSFGPIPTLRLRGLSPDAACERLKQFIAAFPEQLCPFAYIMIEGPYVPVPVKLRSRIEQLLRENEGIDCFANSPTNNNGIYLRIDRKNCRTAR